MNQKLMQKRLDRLNAKLVQLLNDPNVTVNTIEEASKAIKKAQQDKKKLDFKTKLEAVNKEQEKQRKILKDCINIDFPKHEDITNNNGSFHSSKAKKIESLQNILDKYNYVSACYKDGLYTSIKISRYEFRLFKQVHEYNKPTKYLPFESFEEACEYNGIKAKKVLFSSAWANAQKIQKEGEKIKALINKHRKKVESLDKYFLENQKLIQRWSESSLYTNTI